MRWTIRGHVFPESTNADAKLERDRAFGPTVLEEQDGTLRMWYSGHDGSTSRILEAIKPPRRPWARLGVSIDAGLAGPSDAYGVESPSVVAVPGGYLMAYAGSDGADTRLHMAASPDGHLWQAHGTFMQRGAEDAVGATHPCLLVTSRRWWLFYSGYDGSHNGRRASILVAVSDSGASWDRVGPVLGPGDDEVSVSEPWVVTAQRRFLMFYVSDDDRRPTIQMATSEDGVSWIRRGIPLPGSGEDDDTLAERSPCLLRLRDGTLDLWFAARPTTELQSGYRLCSASFIGRDDWLIGG
jgi:predicted GH43/DUF377 family glycosyl hydrolase